MFESKSQRNKQTIKEIPMTIQTFQFRSIGFTTIASLLSLGIGSAASAAPLPGEVLKFQ